MSNTMQDSNKNTVKKENIVVVHMVDSTPNEKAELMIMESGCADCMTAILKGNCIEGKAEDYSPELAKARQAMKLERASKAAKKGMSR